MRAVGDEATLDEIPGGGRSLRLVLGSPRPRLVSCVAWGPEGGPPLLLLHGGGGHALWWAWIGPELARRFRVLAVDLRGHGASDWAEPPSYATADFVADLVEILDRLGLDSVCLAGHSLGGRIAACFASAHPRRVRALAVLDSRIRRAPHGVMTPRRQQLVRQRRGRRYRTREEALSAFRFVPPEHGVDPAVVRVLARYAVARTDEGDWSMRFDRASLSLEGDRADDIAPALEQVRCPTLLVRAESSPITREEEYRTAAARMRTATFRTLPGGHHFLLRYPAPVIRLLGGFFETA